MEFLTGADAFLVGCNYWSSEAGIRMWKDWSEEAVEKDFAALKESGSTMKQKKAECKRGKK